MDQPTNSTLPFYTVDSQRHGSGISWATPVSLEETLSETPRPRISIISCIRDEGRSGTRERSLFPSFICEYEEKWNSTAEIIIVDSSPDTGSRTAIQEAVVSFGGIYVCDATRSQEYSLARARNQGAAAARGEFLLFVDVDLIAPTGFLLSLNSFLESGRIGKAENFFSIIPVLYLNETSGMATVAELRKRPLTDWLYGQSAWHADSIQLVNSTLCVRKSFYTLLGGQHEAFRGWGMEDWHFLWKLMNFPQPVPGLTTETPFHRNPPSERNNLDSWRDAAWFIGDEALRHGLFLVHVPHERRDWRTSSMKNERRFNALVEDRMVFECPPCLKTGAARRVYSDDPVIANALLFPPEDRVSIGTTNELLRIGLRAMTPVGAARPLIGAAQPDGRFYRQFDQLEQRSEPFDFLYPSGVPQALFYFSHEDGNIRAPNAVAQPLLLDLSKTQNLEETAVNAMSFRGSDWRRNKFLVLFIHSEVREAPRNVVETYGNLFGLSSLGFRSLTNSLVPLLDAEVAAMVYDPHSDGKKLTFAAESTYDCSGEALDLLLHAADVVVAQSPRFVLNAAILGKPVITTGTLLADILPSVPIARSLFDVYAFIAAMRTDPMTVSQEEIEKALARACLFAADNHGAPAPADLLRRQKVPRVLYEQVATPDYTARFDFSQPLESTRLLAWMWPHLDEKRAGQRHLALVHDPSFNGTESGWKKEAAETTELSARPAQTKKSPARSEPAYVHVLDPRLAAREEERKKMYRGSGSNSTSSRKMAKLKRDPHQFFADAKSPVLRTFRFFFSAR